MLRTPRRLRLESCEDRSLPAVLAPATHPPLDAASVSRSDPGGKSDDDSEYANSGKPGATATGTGRTTPGFLAGTIGAQVPDYVVAAYPAIPPMSIGPTAPPPPPGQPGPPAAASATLPITTIAPAPTAASPVSPPASPVSDRAAAPLGDDRPDNGPVETVPIPAGGTGDPPAVRDTKFPPLGAVTSGLLTIGDLALRASVADWAAGGRLLEGLDAVADALDAESPWVRLGYWTLAVGAAGVTVELTRQGLRSKRPDPLQRPLPPVTR